MTSNRLIIIWMLWRMLAIGGRRWVVERLTLFDMFVSGVQQNLRASFFVCSLLFGGSALANVHAPKLEVLFLGQWGMLAPCTFPPFLNPSNPEERISPQLHQGIQNPHRMLNPHCRGLEKLSAPFSHKLDPADRQGANNSGCFSFFLKLEERKKRRNREKMERSCFT